MHDRQSGKVMHNILIYYKNQHKTKVEGQHMPGNSRQHLTHEEFDLEDSAFLRMLINAA